MEDFLRRWEARFRISHLAYKCLDYAIELEELGNKELTKELIKEKKEDLEKLKDGALNIGLDIHNAITQLIELN